MWATLFTDDFSCNLGRIEALISNLRPEFDIGSQNHAVMSLAEIQSKSLKLSLTQAQFGRRGLIAHLSVQPL